MENISWNIYRNVHSLFYYKISHALLEWLVTIINPKVKYRFHVAAILFYTEQEMTLTKITYFLKIYYHTQLHNPTLSSITMWHLRNHTVGWCYWLWKLKSYMAPSSMLFILNLMKIHHLVQNLLWVKDKWTDR